MRLTFLGAAGTVTGSRYLLETGERKILVDCGLFQGNKELRERNWQDVAFNPSKLDAVLLTHAHIDHSGFIPRLIRSGFTGPIHCSKATADLCAILLPDSGRIQEDDADSANRYGYSRHKPALPLYTEAEARTAGDGTSILFSGDIGRPDGPLMKAPAALQDADYLVLESTYGNRRHGVEDPATQIGDIIRRTAARGGTVLVPAFAVGRTQDLLFHLHALKRDGRIPDLPVFLDSPMAIDATELLLRHSNEHRLSRQDCAQVCAVARYTRTVEQSKAINATAMPKVIISASGMATGGRVLHHLKHYVGDPRHTILLPGYQAAGTRGDRLARGETSLKIHGHEWPVRAEIAQLDTMSAHADYAEILDWLRNFRVPPRKVFITHGEPEAANAMREHVIETLGWRDVIVPDHGYAADL